VNTLKSNINKENQNKENENEKGMFVSKLMEKYGALK